MPLDVTRGLAEDRPMRALLTLVSAAALLTGCGHTVCNTDADCPADAVCNAQACTKKSAPTVLAPESCGDQCTVGVSRCDFGPTGAETYYATCTVAGDGCSQWSRGAACGDTRRCEEGTGCVPYLSVGQACEGDSTCGLDLSCTALIELGGGVGDPVCRPTCSAAEPCAGTDRCVDRVCVPADFCAACTPGELRCTADAPEQCVVVAEGCARWFAEAACTGSDRCQAGECVGTVTAGNACSDASRCVSGLVCMTDAQTCQATCEASADCGATGCRPTRGSRGYGVCAAGAGPTVESTCVVTVGSAAVTGRWDVILDGSSTPPDPYVVLSGDGFYQTTAVVLDSADARWDARTAELPLRVFLSLTVALWDDDSPFSAPDANASWRIADAVDWDSAARSFDVTLTSAQATLTATVRCTDR